MQSDDTTPDPKSSVDLKSAVKELRTKLGLSQTEFGRLIGKSIATIQRYETLVPPQGKVLSDLSTLAFLNGESRLAQVFTEALRVQMAGRIPSEGRYVPESVAAALDELRSGDRLDWLIAHLESLSASHQVPAGIVGNPVLFLESIIKQLREL